MPRAISRAAVRMKSLNAPDSTTSRTRPPRRPSSLLRRGCLLAGRLRRPSAAAPRRPCAHPPRASPRASRGPTPGPRSARTSRAAGSPPPWPPSCPGRRPHPRLRRPQPGPGDRGGRPALVHDGHDRLADAEAGEDLAEVVVPAVGVGVHGGLERLGVVGRVGAQLVLDPRAELGQHVVGYVGRALGHEEDADALGPDQPHRLGDLVEEVVGGVVEQQVGLVEEEDQGRASRRRRARAGRGTGRPAATSGTWRRSPAGPGGWAARPG